MDAQLFSENGDVGGKITLFDEGIRPRGLDQIILGDDLTGLFHEGKQELDCLWRHRDDSAALEENSRFPIQAKLAEFINRFRLQCGKVSCVFYYVRAGDQGAAYPSCA
jgi:hypothetical protein